MIARREEKRRGEKGGEGDTHYHANPHFLPASFLFDRFVEHDVEKYLCGWEELVSGCGVCLRCCGNFGGKGEEFHVFLLLPFLGNLESHFARERFRGPQKRETGNERKRERGRKERERTSNPRRTPITLRLPFSWTKRRLSRYYLFIYFPEKGKRELAGSEVPFWKWRVYA